MTPLFQSRPNGRRIAQVAWQKFLGALASMPVLFLATATLFALWAYGAQYAGQKLDITDPFLDGMESSSAWFYVVKELVATLLAVPLALASCRFVLRDETGPGLASPEGLAFSLWGLAVAAACLLLLYLKGMMTGIPSMLALVAVLWVIVVMLPMGCLMIFPDIVAGAPAKGLGGRIENSLSTWSGNVLLFVRGAFFVLGPVALLVYAPDKAIANRGGQAFLDRVHASQTWLLATNALTPFLIALTASLLSSFYAGTRAPKA
jgi:hypothetical protein